MQYVRLTARPNTWFKSGTEVYDYDADYCDCKLISLDHWNRCNEDGGICVRGILITPLGEEIVDGEYCLCEEFDVEIVNEYE